MIKEILGNIKLQQDRNRRFQNIKILFRNHIKE